jgi:hypothetical protein
MACQISSASRIELRALFLVGCLIFRPTDPLQVAIARITPIRYFLNFVGPCCSLYRRHGGESHWSTAIGARDNHQRKRTPHDVLDTHIVLVYRADQPEHTGSHQPHVATHAA